MSGVTHHYADLSEVRMHYVTAGEGYPVVLLHGWPQTWYEWRHIIDQLAPHYRVIAPDLRGLGDTSCPASGYDKKTIANDVWELVHHELQLENFYLVGHDWGGPTAYALAAGGPILQPELGGVVLVPIAPHALSNRPIVLSDNHEISIELVSPGESSVNFDMQSLTSLSQHDRVLIRRSAHTVTFLHPEGWNYFDTLREKLHWNEYPSVLGQLK